MRTAPAVGLLFAFALAAVGRGAAGPDTWIPARWDGGPLEVAHRSQDKSLADPAVRNAIARWYEPATLGLLEGTPVNCLLVTLAGGTDRDLEHRQHALVQEYARQARERGMAVLGLVYPGADPGRTAEAAAGLDGVVLEGKFPAESTFIEQLRKALGARNSNVLVIPIAASAEPLRKAGWPVLATGGVSPGVGKIADGATASATAGLWVDSNMWLVRSLRMQPKPAPVWLSHQPGTGSPGDYLKGIADAEAAGGRWIVTLQDELRANLLRRDAKALALWKQVAKSLAFFAEHVEWRSFVPFGTVGIVFDTAGPNLANSEEFLNLVARRQIPYRVIERSQVDAARLTGLRAVLAFDLAPPTAAERKVLQDFAGQGGLVLGGPAWGTPPKEQSYTVTAIDQGEVAVYKEESPDAQSVARDLNDLLTTPDLGVSMFNAPSVLSSVSMDALGKRMLIQMVNYSDAPSAPLAVWTTRKFQAARLYLPEGVPVDLPVKRSGGRTEIAVPALPVYGALVLE